MKKYGTERNTHFPNRIGGGSGIRRREHWRVFFHYRKKCRIYKTTMNHSYVRIHVMNGEYKCAYVPFELPTPSIVVCRGYIMHDVAAVRLLFATRLCPPIMSQNTPIWRLLRRRIIVVCEMNYGPLRNKLRQTNYCRITVSAK